MAWTLTKKVTAGISLAMAIFSLGLSTPQNAIAQGQSQRFTGSLYVREGVVFTPTGAMNTPRDGFTATLLNNGTVLVAGGYDGNTFTNTAEIYDPTDETWSDTGNMNVARTSHRAVLLETGKVLVVGGHNNRDNLSSAELYDPESGTWSATGSLHSAMVAPSIALLTDGNVLAAGSYQNTSAEIYEPSTGIWNPTGSLVSPKSGHTATLLKTGRVLVVGDTAELYDHDEGTWTNAADVSAARYAHTATLLDNGMVLIVGGAGQVNDPRAELYDPATNSWIDAPGMSTMLSFHTATLMANGSVLVIGTPMNDDGSPKPAEIYDPTAQEWYRTGTTIEARTYHVATVLQTGQVLVAGGVQTIPLESGGIIRRLSGAELASVVPSNHFTGTLILPSDWVTQTFGVGLEGIASAAQLSDGSLSNNSFDWGDWIPVASGATASTSLTVVAEGPNVPVFLRLRDVNGQTAAVVTGTVNVDLTPPSSAMTPLHSFTSSAQVPLSWSGSDSLSGVSTFDLQARTEYDDAWFDILNDTEQTSHLFYGIEGTTYYFRVRARDRAGNVEEWREPYDTSTLGSENGLTINSGALFTNKSEVVLTIAADPVFRQMQISNDGGFAGSSWEPYLSHKAWQISQYGSYVLPRTVYLRLRDDSGNVSATYQDDIILDVVAPTGSVELVEYGRTGQTECAEMGCADIRSGGYSPDTLIAGTGINGQVFLPIVSNETHCPTTEPPNITLKLEARDDVSGVADVLISNTPGFECAAWNSYESIKHWHLPTKTTAAVYVRFRDFAGNVSETYTDTIRLP